MGTTTSNRFSWNVSPTSAHRSSNYPVILDLVFGFVIGILLSIVAVSLILKKLKHFLRFNSNASQSLLTTLFTRRHAVVISKKMQSHQFCHQHLSDASRTWMYELRNDDFDSNHFSLSMTRLCLIEIHKNILFIFEPSKEPDRKLTDEELYSYVHFYQVHIYNLNQSIVGLLPNNILRSKYWSKTSPIVLRHVAYLGNEIVVDSFSAAAIRQDRFSENFEQNPREEKTILLFPRTRRAKEDWFYRFFHASQLEIWREEIHHQLLFLNQGTHDQTQVSSLNSPVDREMKDMDQRTAMSTDEQKRHMWNFLERSDRFAAPDQLPDFKPVDVLQRFLPGFKKKKQKIRMNHQPSFDHNNNGSQTMYQMIDRSFNISHSNREDRKMSDCKRHYCEQWLCEQNSSEIRKRDSHSHRDVNTNRKGVPQMSRQTPVTSGSKPFQHPLVFFTLKFLKTMSQKRVDNDIHSPVSLINIFAARCCLDFFDNEQYVERMTMMIQKQLSKLTIPFVEHVTITRLNLGDRLPEITDIFKPWLDEHGLWCHVKIAFDGKFQVSLAAKLKWIRNHRIINKQSSADQQSSSKTSSHSRRSNANNEVDHVRKSIVRNQFMPQSTKISWRKRFWPPIRWFQWRRRRLQQTAETQVIQPNSENDLSSENNKNDAKHTPSYLRRRVLPKVSKTNIVIKMEVNHLDGILVINIPPIPSDRIWISFLDMPEMTFSATPHLGEFRVPFYKIKNKLENKLRQLFRRYLVIPNMKDFVIPTVNDYLSEIGMIKAVSSTEQCSSDANRNKVDEDDHNYTFLS